MKKNKIAKIKVKKPQSPRSKKSIQKSVSQSKKTKTKRKPFFVVGIGASAGGLDALSKLFKYIPDTIGMAFVVVQHLDPKHDSMLQDIVGRLTNMPTKQIKNRMSLKANRIYIIPPNTDIKIGKTAFQVVPRDEKMKMHFPVDYFFSSLAQRRNDRAIGIILSGLGNDGSAGQKEIKEHGGITFSQDTVSAKYTGMPLNAIQTNAIDYVLSPKAIAKALVKISEHLPIKKKSKNSLDESLSGIRGDFAKIFFLLKHFTGVDFSCYKKTTIDRRIQKRMSGTRRSTIKEYLKLIREDPVEVEALFSDLLINVTSFFRDPHVFTILKKKVFPVLLKQNQTDKLIRIWVAACSSGEEVYSMAICLKELMEKNADSFNVQIFGTDVNESVISKARRGLYPDNICSQMSSTILRRYFVKEKNGYRIIKSIRDMCIFAKQDLTHDPPFSKLDFVSCRNMLIYMEPSLQKKVIPLLHYSLNPGGFLMLGTAESVSSYKDYFNVIDKRYKIYLKKPIPIKDTRFYEPPNILFPHLTIKKSSKKKNLTTIDLAEDNLQAKDEELRSAFEEIQSANEELQSTNEELETSKEELQSTNEELATLNDELSNRNTELSQLTSDIQNLFNSTRMPVIMVGRHFKIRRFTPIAKKIWNLIDSDIGRSITDINPNISISNLKNMLIDAIDHLKTSHLEVKDKNGSWYSLAIFPYKTIHNVIDGAVITLNEITVLKKSQKAIEASKEYFENIVKTLPLPILVLDKNLLIRTANQTFYKYFNVSRLKTEGSFIYELSHAEWNIPELIQQLKKVVSENQKFNDFEVHLTFAKLGERILLVSGRAIQENIAGEKLILMYIDDITERVQLENAKKKLVRDISHGVKTPVAMAEMAINLGNDAIKDKNMKAFRHAQSIAQHNIKRVRKDIGLILNSFSMDVKRLYISKNKKRKLSLKTILNTTIITHELLLEEKGLTVKRDLAEQADKIYMDKQDLQVLIDNLFDNAVKFTAKGSISIRTRVLKNWIEIIIKDTGCGIPLKDQSKVFQRFFKKRPTLEGVGLGLSICKEIVALHKGEIRVTSKGRGAGTTVYVKLPRQ